MKKIYLGKSEIEVPNIAIGCMRIANLSSEQLDELVRYSLDNGANFFEHADIYGAGVCESKFGEELKKYPELREKMIIQSKCGIVPGVMYDLSKKHIIESVDKSLESLNTDYLDMLVLHRPDALMDPLEISEAFDELEKSGKVRGFGVSNFNPMQIELLKKYCKQDILVDQLQLSIAASNMISAGLEVNMDSFGATVRDGSVLDYCRLNDVTIQTWSPFQQPNWKGPFIGSEDYKELNEELDKLALEYGVSSTTIAAAWILTHPANMQLISGSTNINRLEQIFKASEIKLTREQWYSLYLKAGHILP